MKIIGKVHKFNTGRHYATNGQEIVWAVIEVEEGRGARRYSTSRVVAFIDQARGIDGVIELHVGNLSLVDDRWVLRAYDDHHWRGYDYEMMEFLRLAAKEA